MRPIYSIARLQDLEKGDWLDVRCVCGHVGKVWPVDLARFNEMTALTSLERRFRCSRCHRKGQVIVAVLDNR